jgi:predicted  nucleic acid-binding Zn-ribbon protein
LIENLRRLLELQNLDDELVALEAEQKEIPAKRAGIEERLAACEARLVASGETLSAAEAGQRRHETEVQDREAQLLKLEGQQHQVKTNEAYTALLSEIAQAKESISEGETGILEGMEAIEAANAVVAEAQRDAAQTRTRLAGDEKMLVAREKELEDRIAVLREQRGGAGAEIDAALMRRYEKVVARRRPGLVVVTGEMCSGCRVDIPAQNFIEILRAETIVACGNCNRILVHEQKLSASSPG